MYKVQHIQYTQMGYLNFEKQDLINLKESLSKELLRTSRTGAYSCTTVSGCNTRKYHGLLVCPIKSIDNDLHVLLSSLDETVIQHNSEFNLGIHKFAENHYSPKGHKYIREFECESIPIVTYRVGGVILTREKVFISGEDRVLLRYTLVEAHSPTTIRFKPFFAFRNYHQLMKANLLVKNEIESLENGLRFKQYENYPELYLQFSKDNEFISVPDWYYGIEYSKEQERGYEFSEDLFVPGYFELPISKGETIVVSAGLSEINTETLKRKFNIEVNRRPQRNSLLSCLDNAAQQFFIIKNDELDIQAGYPWFKPRARDTFISLLGLTLSRNDQISFRKAEKKVIEDFKAYLSKGTLPENVDEYDAPDVSFWALNCFQQIVSVGGAGFNRYKPIFEKVFRRIYKSKLPGIRLDQNGLIAVTSDINRPASWMNSSVNNIPVNPRYGYLPEINALWYNSLVFYFKNIKQKSELSTVIEKTISQIEQNFANVFWNTKHDCLFDFVNGDEKNSQIRPNMLFAIGLPHSALTKEQQKRILDVVNKYLFTPRGLRTLSPEDPMYIGELVGDHNTRHYGYHQGTAWPWLLGVYGESYLKIYKNSGVQHLKQVIEAFDDEMSKHCIGTLSEYYDGDPPHQGRGAVSYAANVAEMIRLSRIINNV